MKKYKIYKFTNKINGKVYIGKTVQELSKRKHNHLHFVKRGSKFIIHKAIGKYGIENFSLDVVFNTFSENDLNFFEEFFIKEYDCCVLDGVEKGYNMTRGGEGFSSETAKKYAGWNKPDYVNPFSGEKGSKMSTEYNLERVKNGTNPWAGEKGSEQSRKVCEKQLKEGRHPFQGEHGSKMAKERNRKSIENKTHTNFKTFTCPHCNKVGVGRNMFRWHFNQCKLKPI
jgi:group I intron endonuclease